MALKSMYINRIVGDEMLRALNNCAIYALHSIISLMITAKKKIYKNHGNKVIYAVSA